MPTSTVTSTPLYWSAETLKNHVNAVVSRASGKPAPIVYADETVGYGCDDLYVATIPVWLTRLVISHFHYSKRVVNNSYLHLGIFEGRDLVGVMQWGYAMNPSSGARVVTGTGNREYMELNRFWVHDRMGGCLIGVQRFTASGTYTPTPGTRYVIVEAVGGGGGGCSNTSADNSAVSGGGGSGSYVHTKIDNATVGDAVAITIGIGGAGGVGGSAGTTGGDTKFGSLVTATGGRGGTTSTSSSSFAFIAVGGAPGANPSVGNLISSRGSRGGSGLFFNSSTGAVGGDGAPSQFGGSGIGSGSSGTTGSDGSGFGSGGGGNARQSSSASVNGYAGAPGVIVIYEYS